MSALLDALKDPFASDSPSFLEEVLQPLAAVAQTEKTPANGESNGQDEERPGKSKKRARSEAKKGPTLNEVAHCCAFSERGSYLLAGTLVTGVVIVRDLVTRAVVAAEVCHANTVTSVSYLPRTGSRLIMTTSLDGLLKVFDLDGFRCRAAYDFGRPVVGASAVPSYDGRASKRCLVSLAQDADAGADAWPWPILFDLEVGEARTGDTVPEPGSDAVLTAHNGVALSWENSSGGGGGSGSNKAPKVLVAAWSRDSATVLVGGHGGEVHIFDGASGALKETQRPVTRKGLAQHMVVSDNGKIVLLRITEKVIHMLRLDKGVLVHLQDLQDSVEGTRWSSCAVSPDSEYVIAGCSKTHTLHVWNVLGRHMATLRAPTTGLVRYVLWHPSRPVVASLGRGGHTFLWSTHRSESWSAFAPNFVQLEDNIEYHEREDEFDKNRARDLAAEAPPSAAEAEPVDVLRVDPAEEAGREWPIPFMP